MPRQPKNSKIADGFNKDTGQRFTNKEKKALRRSLPDDEVKKLNKKLAAEEKFQRPEEEVPQEVEDKIASYRMLQDMRWVYKKVDGRKKLLELVDADDKQFAFMVKELIKFETARMEKDKGNSADSNQNFFVILKGLDDEEALKQKIGNVIDTEQVKITMTPDERDFAEQVQKIKEEGIVINEDTKT
jgi:hypothetical protein